ncbi:hypothetical protein HCN44_003198 [Aphidius gifuensis]|uniref:Uncharacterized protein n=1 Tax=Aphidius gifuensis TaxID=684658 RepID=A0A834XMG9_APHGI|nr:hypothetical protein HCN44_003198 [Aphidius gifuensis]
MKALSEINPWGSSDCQECESNDELTKFEDSFVVSNDSSRLSDSDQYLARLYSRLKNAMAPSELVHLLKADVLQAVTDEQLNQADDTTNKSDDEIPINDKVDTDSLQSH